jgi:2-polyprenyl-6-methoxyphenol hydroxylase-like FAD-dependent oxidoreductase
VRYGFKTTLVEKFERLRTGGYVIDFWGRGFDVAEKMGLLPALKREGYDVKELRFVGANGRRVGGFSAGVFRSATNGRYVSIPRGDLARIIYQTIEHQCETAFGDSVTKIVQDEDRVRVDFERKPPQDFDIVRLGSLFRATSEPSTCCNQFCLCLPTACLVLVDTKIYPRIGI